MDIVVENVVAFANAEGAFDDPEKIAKNLGVEYRKAFPGVIYEPKEGDMASIIFRNGTIVCSGARSVEEAARFIKSVVEKAGLELKGDIKVKNMVLSYDIGKRLVLEDIVPRLESGTVTPPREDFPAIIYRPSSPPVTMLIFPSGKVVLTGVKKIEEAEKALDILIREIGVQ